MISLMTGIVSGIVALFVGLLGLGVGAGLLMLVMVPAMLVLLVLILPAFILLVILRRAGLVRSRFAAFVVLLLGVVLMLGAANYGWSSGLISAKQWLNSNEQMLEACRGSLDNSVTIERDKGGVHFSCHSGTIKKRPPGEDI